MHYAQNGINGHFEAIMRKSSRGGSIVADNALFATSALPSYIYYLVFTQICGFDMHGEFAYLNADSPYLAMSNIKSNVTRMYNIYVDSLSERGIQEIAPSKVQPNVEPMYLQLGGEVKRYITNYMQHSNTQAKNAYYVVIDLDLFPGDSISRSDKFRLNCAGSYDKMSQAWADIWGLRYEPGELNTARLKRDVPTAEGIPVASIERRPQTLKRVPSAPPETRRVYQGGKHKTRRHVRAPHKTRKFAYLR